MSSFNVEPILKERYTDLGTHTHTHTLCATVQRTKKEKIGRESC